MMFNSLTPNFTILHRPLPRGTARGMLKKKLQTAWGGLQPARYESDIPLRSWTRKTGIRFSTGKYAYNNFNVS